MNRIAEIERLAHDSLVETNLQLKEKKKAKLKKDIDSLSTRVNSKDKMAITNIPNTDVLIIFLNILNDDQFTYEETFLYVEEIKPIINSWTFDIHGEDLQTMFEQTNQGGLNDFKYISSFNNLKLTPAFLNYRMKYIYQAMYCFLKLKCELVENNLLLKNSTSKFLLSNPTTKRVIPKNPITVLDTIYKNSDFRPYVHVAEEYIKKEMQDFEQITAALLERKKYTEKLLSELKKPEFASIKSIKDKWHQYLDPKVLEELYSLINANLLEEEKTLSEEEKELNSVINKNALTRYLYKAGLNPSSLNREQLTILEQDPIIVKKIETLLSIGISLNDILTKYYNYLISLDEDKISKLTFLINSNILSKETLRNNLSSILDDRYQELLVNYQILKDIIDFNNIFYNDRVMFIKPHALRDILSVLAQYNLTRNNYIFLLCHYEFINIYDLVIEHDIPYELFISICKTKKPEDTIKRIIIYQNISEEYATQNHQLKKSIIDENHFLIPSDSLNELTNNIVPSLLVLPITGTRITNILEHPIVKKLEENRVDNLYVFGHINISRPKFLRNFESVNGDSRYLISSLISASILEESQYYSLCNELETQKLLKK